MVNKEKMEYRNYQNGLPRFVLDKRKPRGKYKTKCPKCGDVKSFVCIVDTTTGEPVDASRFGVCDHERRCGYSCWPTGKDVQGLSLIVSSNEVKKEFLTRDEDIANTIDPEIMLRYCRFDPESPFLKALSILFGNSNSMLAMHKYFIGTRDYFSWNKPTIFWQIDRFFKVRTGKIMEFGILSREDGSFKDVKRVQPGNNFPDVTSPHVSWVHNFVSADYSLKQCLFGEHLLNQSHSDSTIDIVESEKTAIIASLYYPERIWMATGGLQNLRPEVMSPLKRFKIMLHPDKGEAFEKWEQKVGANLPDYNIKVSKFLENKDLPDGSDIADYIIRKVISGN